MKPDRIGQVASRKKASSACEAGASVKPSGVQRSATPGSGRAREESPCERATASILLTSLRVKYREQTRMLSKTNGAVAARLHGLKSTSIPFPGAYAPGFMLSPASQAKKVAGKWAAGR